jgi:hypothetical protein
MVRESDCDCAGAGAYIENAYGRGRVRSFPPFRQRTPEGLGTQVLRAFPHLFEIWGARICYESEDLFDEVFGLRAGDEDVGGYAKGQAIEFAFAGDVLDGFAFAAAFKQAGVADCSAASEVVFGVCHQPGFVFADQMHQQCFGVALRTVRVRAVAELRFGLGEPLAQRHQAA